jgi:hypothetical protein
VLDAAKTRVTDKTIGTAVDEEQGPSSGQNISGRRSVDLLYLKSQLAVRRRDASQRATIKRRGSDSALESHVGELLMLEPMLKNQLSATWTFRCGREVCRQDLVGKAHSPHPEITGR